MRYTLVLLPVVCVALLAEVAQANPTSMDPVAPLVIRVDDASSQLLARLVQLDALARRTLSELDVPRSKRPPSQREIDEIGRVAMALAFEEHFARRLADRSEAAGYDYLARSHELSTVMRRVVAEFKSGGGVRTDTIERELRAVHDVAARKLPELKSRSEGEQLESVEQEYVQILAELMRYGVWVENVAPKFYRPFAEPLEKVRAAASAQRQQRLREELTQLTAVTRPNFDELPNQLTAAAESLKTSPQASWQGETLSGPDLIPRAVETWQIVNLRAQRTRMLHLAGRGGETAVPEPVAELSAGQAEFTHKVIAGIAAVVAADAARAAPREARSLYQTYVDRLSHAALACDRQVVLTAWEQPLAQLAEKDPTLKLDVQNYVRATRELLRWRRDMVEIELAQRVKSAPDVQSVFHQAIRPSGGPALLTENALPNQAALLSSAAAVLPLVQEKAIGRPATIREVTGLGAGKSIAAYHLRLYARTTLPYSPTLEQHIDALRAMLLVTPTQGPLSLDAAIALAAAEEGTSRAIGGTVSQVTLEPLLTRFATLPDRSRGLLTLKTLPEEIQASDLRSAVLAHFDLVPGWVAHEAFVVDLQLADAPSAAPPPTTAQPVAQVP